MRVLIVCKGNTCRSPMFAAVLRRELTNQDRRHSTIVASAGMEKAAEGQPAAADWTTLVDETKVDLSVHRSRHISNYDLGQFDKIICLDAAVHAQLSKSADSERVVLCDIPNPWQQGTQAYRDCYKTICKLVPQYC